MPWDLSSDRTAALERMTEALRAAMRAKERGLDVEPIREALKSAQKAFMHREYLASMQFANQALELCGEQPP